MSSLDHHTAKTEPTSLRAARQRIEKINEQLLALLAERARLVMEIRELKDQHGIPLYSPDREVGMLEDLLAKNPGPFGNDTVRALFREIFRASLDLMESARQRKLRVSREYDARDVELSLPALAAANRPYLIAGPCSIESAEQIEAAAELLSECGITLMRGGAYKPRTSPYAFQGLGLEGLRLLKAAAARRGLLTVSEIVDTRQVEEAASCIDIFQVGTRNMSNFALLCEIGKTRKPVILKRGLAATIDEFVLAAEYIVKEGNEQVILCERGIRTFENQTRYTLDISAVPLLQQMTRLPVIVDVSHAAGRKDVLTPLARAALAAGADGIMVEVHPSPHEALSDADQQMSPDEFRAFVSALGLGARLRDGQRSDLTPGLAEAVGHRRAGAGRRNAQA